MKKSYYTMFVLFSLAMVASCGAAHQLPVYRLERGSQTLSVTGTIHALTEDWSEQLFPSTRLARNAIAASDVLFLEIDPDGLDSVDEPDPDERSNDMSLSAFLKSEGDGVYEAFRRDLQAFPFMNHVGRQASLMQKSPRDAYSYLYFDVMESIAGLWLDFGLDTLYYQVAADHDIPVEGLEELALLDDLHEVNQSIWVTSVRALVSARPDNDDIKIAYDRFFEASSKAMISGSPLTEATEMFYAVLGVERSEPRESSVAPTAGDSVTDARHETWIRNLHDYLDRNQDHTTVFAAVGYAHLVGEEPTFLDKLADAGWSLISDEPWSSGARTENGAD